MLRQLTNRERKIAALSALAFSLWAAWSLLIDGLLIAPFRDANAQIQTLQEQHLRYSQLLQKQPAIKADLQKLKAESTHEQTLFVADDPVAAAADLMQYAVEQVEAQSEVGPGCEVTQRIPITSQEAEQTEPYLRIKVGMTLRCAMEPLTGLLVALEYGHPSVMVEELSIRKPSNASASAGPGLLDVNLLLKAYMSPPAGDKQS